MTMEPKRVLALRSAERAIGDWENDSSDSDSEQSIFRMQQRAIEKRIAKLQSSAAPLSTEEDSEEQEERLRRRSIADSATQYKGVRSAVLSIIHGFYNEEDYTVEAFLDSIDTVCTRRDLGDDARLEIAICKLRHTALSQARSLGLCEIKSWKKFQRKMIEVFSEVKD